MAWAPPTRYTSVTSQSAQAARIVGWALPSGPGGAHTASSSTPAVRATVAHITTVDGYGARPPGTEAAARRTGTSAISTTGRSGRSTRGGCVRSPALATARTFAIAVLSPRSTAGSSVATAASISWSGTSSDGGATSA